MIPLCATLETEELMSFQVRQVKRNDKGKAGPHRYAQAWSLTTTDAIGRFLGVNVGTPLQKKLSRLAVLLFCIAVVCAIIVLAANDFSNEQEVIIYAVATGLSMIPASLIVVLTITMAAGTKRMVERHVIVRNLKSLEALGAVTDICSDKTGTSYLSTWRHFRMDYYTFCMGPAAVPVFCWLAYWHLWACMLRCAAIASRSPRRDQQLPMDFLRESKRMFPRSTH